MLQRDTHESLLLKPIKNAGDGRRPAPSVDLAQRSPRASNSEPDFSTMFQKIVSTKSNKIVQPNPGQEIQEVLRGYVNISQFTRHTSLVCGLLVLSGCGKAAPWEKAHPAKGVVTHKGKPVANADVAFFPEDKTFPETVRPRAKTDENGNFVVWTYKEGDGAPAGSYKATVVHYDVVINNNVARPKPNDLPPKYATFQATDLLVKIDPGNNEIPAFDLK